MKKRLIIGILCALLVCTCLFGVTACNGNTSDNGFTVGEEVRSSLKLPWKMPIYNTSSNSSDDILDSDTATITEYVLTANRVADMGNIADYFNASSYYRYIYDAKIIGKVDSKFADRVVWVGCRYTVDVGTKNKVSPSSGTEVEADGSFTYEFFVYSNEPITDFTPAQVTIGSYITYYLTYKNTYNTEFDLPYKLPNSYTKKSFTILLPSLGNRTEYEEVDGEYKQVTYIFDGWYNEDTLVSQIPQGSTGDMELTAHWKLAD